MCAVKLEAFCRGLVMSDAPVPKVQAPTPSQPDDSMMVGSQGEAANDAQHNVLSDAQGHAGILPPDHKQEVQVSNNDKIGKGNQIESSSEFTKKQTREFEKESDQQESDITRAERAKQGEVRTARLEVEKARTNSESMMQENISEEAKTNPFLFTLSDVARAGAFQVITAGFDRLDLRAAEFGSQQKSFGESQAPGIFMQQVVSSFGSKDSGGKPPMESSAGAAGGGNQQPIISYGIASFGKTGELFTVPIMASPPLSTVTSGLISTSPLEAMSDEISQSAGSSKSLAPPIAPPQQQVINDTSSSDTTPPPPPPNSSPSTADVARSIAEGASQVSGLLTATDADGDTLVFSTASSAAYGTLSLSTSGAYTYQLNNNSTVNALSVGASLLDSFTFSVSDGQGGSSSSVLRITITGVNDATSASAGTKAATEDAGAVTGTLVATDVDTGDTLTYSVITDGTYGTFSVTNSSTGAYSYTLNDANATVNALAAGATLTDTLTFRATDSNGATNNANVVVTITGANDAPSASAGTKAATEDAGAVTGTLVATDVDTGDTLTYSVITDGTYGTFSVTNSSTGAYSYTLNDANATVNALAAGATLTDTLTFRATDSNSATSNANVVVTITGANDAPTISGLATSASHNENTINAAASIIDSAVVLADVDSSNFNGGNLTITYAAGGGSEDQLTVANQGSSAGQIGVSGSTVSYEGNNIGTISTNGANGANLAITFNTVNATIAAIDALIQAVTYQNTSNAPTSSRTLRVTVNDGDGGTSANNDITVTVNAEGDAFTLTSGTDTFVSSSGSDTFTTTEANFAAADTLTGGADTDTVIFSDAATITTAELANKTGIEVIQFGANSTAAISDAFVDASDSDSLELNNQTYTLSLNASDVSAPQAVVISGTGTVTLSAAATVSSKAGVNTTIVGSTGADTITGGSGADTLTGGYGGDTISGGAGADTIYADNQAFTVNSITSGTIKMWFTADSLTGLSDGSAITTWADSAGGNENATQSTVLNKPSYETTVFSSGRSGVYFDGSDWINATAASTVQNNYSVFAIARTDIDTTGPYAILSTRGESTLTYFDLKFQDGTYIHADIGV